MVELNAEDLAATAEELAMNVSEHAETHCDCIVALECTSEDFLIYLDLHVLPLTCSHC